MTLIDGGRIDGDPFVDGDHCSDHRMLRVCDQESEEAPVNHGGDQ